MNGLIRQFIFPKEPTLIMFSTDNKLCHKPVKSLIIENSQMNDLIEYESGYLQCYYVKP